MPRVRKGRAALLAAGLPAAGLAGLAWVRYRREIREQRKRVAGGSQIASTRCGPIEYAVAGSGPPLLLVHGAGGGYDQGLSLGATLAARGFQVIAMSRFGYLRTPLPLDASPEAQADAHACLLDALGIGRVAVMGASAGAPSAMQFALRHPDRTRALVLLVPAAWAPRAGGAPALKTPPGLSFLFETALSCDFLFWAATRLARPFVTRAILATPPEVVKNADAAEQARVADMLEQILPVSARREGLINDAAVVSAITRYDLERIAVPTLAISTKDDLYGTYDGSRYSAEHVSGARFLGFPTGGHLCVGHNEEIAAEIAALLTKPD
jgi:2-hydroxy-6-oxonona-2,4-dienedioate hydrolase